MSTSLMQSVNYSLIDENPQKELDKLQKKFNKLAVLSVIIAIFGGFFAITSLYFFLRMMNEGSLRIPSESIIIPTPEMAINHEIADDSAAFANGSGNHKNSAYFAANNFYDGDVSKTLSIFPKFKTYQQTSVYSCGAASAYMALRHFGIDNFTENDIAIEAGTVPHDGTFTVNLGNALVKLAGDKLDVTWSAKDQDLSWEQYMTMLTTMVTENKVTLVGGIEWGGHWMVLIGYDSMGTEDPADDVVIMADPFDTTDHRQDGYLVLSSQRFYSMWILQSGTVFPEGYHRYQFVTVSEKK